MSSETSMVAASVRLQEWAAQIPVLLPTWNVRSPQPAVQKDLLPSFPVFSLISAGEQSLLLYWILLQQQPLLQLLLL